MQKFATALMMLLPAMAFAHGSNDLSQGHAHYWSSLHHFVGIAILAAIGVGAIWFYTRQKPKPRKIRVKVEDR